MSDAIKAAIRAERDALRAFLADIRRRVVGRPILPETVVDMVSSHLDERDEAESQTHRMD